MTNSIFDFLKLRIWSKFLSFVFCLFLFAESEVLAVETSYPQFYPANSSAILYVNYDKEFRFEAFNNNYGNENSQTVKLMIPPMMVFGKVQKDHEKAVPYTITNPGQSNLKIDSMKFSGVDASEFKISSPVFPVTIEPSKEITINAVFNPKKVGIKDVKLIVYSSDDLIKGEVGVTAEAYVETSGIALFKTSDLIPEGFSLKQNYPNPFNPSTKIIYDLPEAAVVSLKIFNSFGQEVDVLLDQQQAAGRYSLEWIPANLPSGVYYYKLQTGRYNDVKKLLFLK